MTRANTKPRLRRPPKADASIYAALSQRFRARELYAYSYDHERGHWSTWETETDWLATERNGTVRVPAEGHGPTDWQRSDLLAWLEIETTKPKMTRTRQVTRPDGGGGSDLVAALEATYGAIRANHDELPDVVIITGSGMDSYGLKWGHFGPDRWKEALTDGRRPEMFIGGERLACGAELTLQTMLHECAHALACVRGVADTSRQHRYHNRRFVELANELGLDYPHGGPDATIGFSAVEITDEARKRYEGTLSRLSSAITLHLDDPRALLVGTTGGAGLGGHGGRVAGGKRTTGTGGTSLVRAVCACEPGRIIRVSATVLAGPAITCECCEKAFAA